VIRGGSADLIRTGRLGPPESYLASNPMGGSLWIMTNLNHNMMPMDQIMQMQR
jgi:hypothetical protein